MESKSAENNKRSQLGKTVHYDTYTPQKHSATQAHLAYKSAREFMTYHLFAEYAEIRL